MVEQVRWIATRLHDSPIIDQDSCKSIGANIQGPSAIRVPEWIKNPLGHYYLYFADHKGKYIRLAYSDHVKGSWKVHVPGSLHLRDSHFATTPPDPSDGVRNTTKMELPHSHHKERSTPHLASPDVHVDHSNHQVVMYFHGLESYGYQASRVGTSSNGIDFCVQPKLIAQPYLRVFSYDGQVFGMSMPGQFYRCSDGFAKFEPGPLLFNQNMRHAALLVRNGTLHVFWTQVGDTPERILVSSIDLTKPFDKWLQTEPYELLRPERVWEGSEQPLVPSIRSVAYGLVNQLRDPAILEDDGRVYLFYAVGGESGIGIAELSEN